MKENSKRPNKLDKLVNCLKIFTMAFTLIKATNTNTLKTIVRYKVEDIQSFKTVDSCMHQQWRNLIYKVSFRSKFSLLTLTLKKLFLKIKTWTFRTIQIKTTQNFNQWENITNFSIVFMSAKTIVYVK